MLQPGHRWTAAVAVAAVPVAHAGQVAVYALRPGTSVARVRLAVQARARALGPAALMAA